jgi:CHASE3 domain sensor protein
MMELVSAESQARLVRANRNYARARKLLADARAELTAAVVEERREGTLIEDITALVEWRQTQVNRVLEAAGLTEKRIPRESDRQAS